MTDNPADDHILQVSGLGKRYRRGWALRDFSLEVARGSITALVGPNGAGKTTLMMSVAGLIEPTEGSIVVNGVRLRPSATLPDIGYLSQDKPLYRQFTVSTMLEVGRHLNVGWNAALAARLCDEAGLAQRAKVRTLSGGQRTRLALALVLARRPELLLLDEPLADLDPLARLEVQQTLLAQATETGMSVLMSSHILGEVQDVCSDLALITNGRLTMHGDIDDIVAQHQVLVGPAGAEPIPSWLPAGAVVEARQTPRQATILVREAIRQLPDGWTAEEPSLEEIVVARLRSARDSSVAADPTASAA